MNLRIVSCLRAHHGLLTEMSEEAPEEFQNRYHPSADAAYLPNLPQTAYIW